MAEEELKEKDFIQEQGFKKDPGAFWIWAAAFCAFMVLVWGGTSWYGEQLEEQVEENPFLQVTNRKMSLFLWEFPERMRQHVRERENYLPGFEYQERVGLRPAQAERFAMGPPELFFLYHTWDRLLAGYFFERPIPRTEFMEFLNSSLEWRPENWPEATPEYASLVRGIKFNRTEDLAALPEEELPQVVRRAFQGWKNYFLEGTLINRTFPTFGEMRDFVKRYPHYGRSYWRNVVAERYPRYLEQLARGDYDPAATVPYEEVAPFLRVAFFNRQQSLQGK